MFIRMKNDNPDLFAKLSEYNELDKIVSDRVNKLDKAAVIKPWVDMINIVDPDANRPDPTQTWVESIIIDKSGATIFDKVKVDFDQKEKVTLHYAVGAPNEHSDDGKPYTTVEKVVSTEDIGGFEQRLDAELARIKTLLPPARGAMR